MYADFRAKVAVEAHDITTSEKQPLCLADGEVMLQTCIHNYFHVLNFIQNYYPVIDCLVKLRANQEEQEQLSLQAWEIVAEQQNLHLKTMLGQRKY